MLIITIKREDIPMKALWIAPVAVLGFFGFSPTGDTRAGDERPIICGAALDGFGQVPPVITTGMATFKVRINHNGTITYKLSYAKLAGTGEVLFADVHFGQQQNTGGILFLLCANVATAPSQGVPPLPGPPPGTTVPGTVNVPTGTQACPAGKGTLTGTIRATDIVGAPVQGIQPGDLAAAVEVLGSGQSYAQIHTKLFTPGEVRGQIEVEDERERER
jgi:hypothetical protein